MAYNPKTNWQLNEIVMPADMNRIEQGIADLDSQLGDKANLSDIPTKLPANGGIADTARQTVSPNAKAKLWEDSEGGNLRLVSPDGNHSVEMDLYNNEGFRMYFTDNGELTFPVDYNSTTKKFNINGNADTVDGKHASDFALKTDIPTTLPANGGRADVANVAYHQVEHFLESGTDILSYVTSDTCPAPFNTIVRILHSPTCPTNYGYSASDNDFFYHIFKLDNSWATIKAFDIRGNVEFINSCLNGTWSGWIRCNDGGNAATVNGLTVQTAVPANAKFTDTTYGVATASAAGLVSTREQTFAGNKTFNGQIIPAGASAVGTAQARKIYAGTSDMTAGTTALETGAIYLVYE